MENTNHYKREYEAELERTKVLEEKVASAREEMNASAARLERIKGSTLWKMSKPARDVIHFLQRTKQRLGAYGSIRGILRKLDSKRHERQARFSHGTRSFPDKERRTYEENNAWFDKKVTFSILVPLYNTPKKFLTDMIESVIAQTYGKWELCLADGSDDEHAYVGQICETYVDKDDRIKYKKLEKNEGISGNTNECFKMATGEYIALFDHDDILHPSVLYEYVKVINTKDADYIYCDETTFKGNSVDNMITLHFKPDFAIDNLRANNYICHFSAFSRELLDGMELFRPKFDGSQDHDMILRLTSRAKNVVHVPRLMYYWRSHKASVAKDINAKSYAIDAAKGAVADHLLSCGYENFEITSTRAFETIFRIRYEIKGDPKVSIIIPNKDHADDLKRCISSIIEKSTYDNYEIVVVENNSITEEIFTYYEEISAKPNVKVVTWNAEVENVADDTVADADKPASESVPAFNYSAICNFGVRESSGDYVLLLNNDTEVITLDWIEELLMYAQREDVACAGAKLYYPDMTIQHAGVVIGLGAHRTAGHTHYRMPVTNLGYMGRLCYAQDVTAVTGACLLVSRKIYDEVGGLDESFRVSLNDVDFCLKCRKMGYLNVFTPFAELFHYESISRGNDTEGASAERYNEESERFRIRWKEELDAGDPYYNPNFSLDRSDYTIIEAPASGRRQ